jgi:hypothetical protein
MSWLSADSAVLARETRLKVRSPEFAVGGVKGSEGINAFHEVRPMVAGGEPRENAGEVLQHEDDVGSVEGDLKAKRAKRPTGHFALRSLPGSSALHVVPSLFA